MSHHPAYSLAALCAVGGVVGFARTKSVPSLVGGLVTAVGFAASARAIQEGKFNAGYAGAAATSGLLLASSAPRFRKGPVPAGLAALGTVGLAYYGKKVYDFRVWE